MKKGLQAIFASRGQPFSINDEAFLTPCRHIDRMIFITSSGWNTSLSTMSTYLYLLAVSFPQLVDIFLLELWLPIIFVQHHNAGSQAWLFKMSMLAAKCLICTLNLSCPLLEWRQALMCILVSSGTLQRLELRKCRRVVVYVLSPFGVQGSIWMCIELMDTSLEIFYKKVYACQRKLPEEVLGVVAYSVSFSNFFYCTRYWSTHQVFHKWCIAMWVARKMFGRFPGENCNLIDRNYILCFSQNRSVLGSVVFSVVTPTLLFVLPAPFIRFHWVIFDVELMLSSNTRSIFWRGESSPVGLTWF